MHQSVLLAPLAHHNRNASSNSKATSSSHNKTNSKMVTLRLVVVCSGNSSNRKVDIIGHQINRKVERRNITLHHKILMMTSSGIPF